MVSVWREGGRTYLVVADVVVAFVSTSSIRSGLQRSGNVLDVGDSVNQNRGRPGLSAQRFRIKIHCIDWQNKGRCVRRPPEDVERCSDRSLTLLRTVCTIAFVRTVKAACCVASFLGFLVLAKMLQRAEGRYPGDDAGK